MMPSDDTHDQFVTVDGRVVDQDIELVTAMILDRDFSDPLLSRAFWLMFATYYKGAQERLATYHPNGEYLKHDIATLCQAHVRGPMIQRIMRLTGIRFETLNLNNPQVPQGTRDLATVKSYYASRVELIPFGMTEFMPGVTEGHSLVLALMQGARQLSGMNLNRGESQLLQ